MKKLMGWLFWFIAALFYAYEFLHRVLPSILLPELRIAFSANDHQLGSIAAMYFYAYAALQLPAGILVDKYGAKRLLVLASAVLTLGSFLFTTTSSILIAHLSRLMIGAGSAFAFIGCLKIGGEWLDKQTFPLIVGLTNLFGTMGALLGGKPLSYLIQHIGWREVLMQISFAGLLITLLLWLFLEDPPSRQTAPPPGPHVPESKHSLSGLFHLLKCGQSWLIALYGALLVAPIIALPEMWGVDYLKQIYTLSVVQASQLTHTIFIGTAIGGPLIGWLAGRIEQKTNFMLFTSVGALLLLLLFIYCHTLPYALIFIILFFYGILTANMLLCFTLISQLHPTKIQGTAIGFTNMIIMACGGLAQHSIGWILHHVTHDYTLALSILPLCLIMAIGLTRLIKEKPRDI